MSLEEKEFVDRVFAIEDKLSILELAIVDGSLFTVMCMITSVVYREFIYLAFIFGIVTCSLILVGIEVGYFSVINFRRVYMPTYSCEELEFINRCESRNPFATANFVKYQHLFVE